MNCIAIDDEPLALNIIKEFCDKLKFLQLKGIFTNAFDAIKAINREAIDVIFLDIHMPNISGLEFIKSLPNPPMIIFTTAYSEHALEGFELNAIDYLVKPISFDRFLKAVNKAYELHSLMTKNNKENLPEENKHNDPGYMMIKVEYSTVKLNYDKILYIEGLKDYVKIYAGDKPLITKSTLKNIENKLPSDRFVRVHKSYIISLGHITKIENNRIIFGEKRIPVGDQYKELFYKLIDKHRL